MARVPLVVSDQQKARWDEFAKEQDHIDDRSDLIRTAVSKYIADIEGESELPEQIEERFDEVMIQFEQLESQLSFASEAFEGLQQSQIDEETVEDIVEFHAELVRDEIDSLAEDVEGPDGE